MCPVCQAERAVTRCGPPEQRTVGGLGADASGGGLTKPSTGTDRFFDYLTTDSINYLFFICVKVYLQSMLDLVFIACQAWQAGAEGVCVLRDLSS